MNPTLQIPLPGVEPTVDQPVVSQPTSQRANQANLILADLLGGASIGTKQTKIKEALAGEFTESISPSTTIKMNTSDPKLEIVANFLAAGKSRKEIAELTGMGYSTVITLSNQPYVRKRIRELISANGGNAIKSFLNTQISQCLEVLVQVRDNPEAKTSDRLAATNALLDRALGKPTQHIETKSTDISDAPLEIADIQAKLAETTAKLKERGISLPN